MRDEIRLREMARNRLREMPEEERARVLRPVEQVVLDRNPDTPPEEIRVEGLGLDALVEEIYVRRLARLFGDFDALRSEHVTPEDIEPWMAEESSRLRSDYPGGSVPEDALVDTVYARMMQERPQLGRGRSK
jgi:hypothetical protein